MRDPDAAPDHPSPQPDSNPNPAPPPAGKFGAELPRRSFLRTAGSAAIATAALAGVVAARAPAAPAAPSHDPEEAKARLDHSNSNFGPANRPAGQPASRPSADESPESEATEPTDAGDVPVFWYSMDLSKKRISEAAGRVR